MTPRQPTTGPKVRFAAPLDEEPEVEISLA